MWHDLFSLTFPGTPLELFSATHLLALAAVVASCVVLAAVLAPLRNAPGPREAFRHGLAWFTLLNFAVWYVWEWQVGLSSWAYSLPLQVCTVSLLLCPWMLWSRKVWLFELCYFWGFAGATQALLTPDLSPYNFPHFVAFQFFISHACILWCVIFMLVVERYRPHWSSLARVIPLTIAWMGVAGLGNMLTGGNYMYVARKPPVPTLLDYLGPWPWYVLVLVAIGSVMMVLVYLPFVFADLSAKRYHRRT